MATTKLVIGSKRPPRTQVADFSVDLMVEQGHENSACEDALYGDFSGRGRHQVAGAGRWGCDNANWPNEYGPLNGCCRGVAILPGQPPRQIGVALVGLAVWLVFTVRAQGEALRELAAQMGRFDERLRAVEVTVARLATGREGAS